MRIVLVIVATVGLVVALGVAFVLVGPPSAVHSVVSTGPDGLRTFTIAGAEGGQPILCTLGKPIPPVTGRLGGQAGAPDPAWLVAADGRRLIVVWPAGFSVRFDPEVHLFDDRGRSVAMRNDPVELGVRMTDAAGTHDDPYIADGIEFGGCYPYAP
jgi:hypothetical protein